MIVYPHGILSLKWFIRDNRAHPTHTWMYPFEIANWHNFGSAAGYWGWWESNCYPPGENKVIHPPTPPQDVIDDPDRTPAYMKGSKYPLRYLVVPPAGVGDGTARPVRAIVNDEW